MSDVFVVGVGCTTFGKHWELGFRDLTRLVVDELLADVGEESADAMRHDLGSTWFGNCFMHGWGQPNVRGQIVMTDLMEEGVLPWRMPITNVEAACATGSQALLGAIRDIRSGDHELSLAVGVEKLTQAPSAGEHASSPADLLAGCTDNLSFDRLVRSYRDALAPIGEPFAPGSGRSIFMDTYAAQAQLHMEMYGTTAEQIAVACAKNHNFGALNPRAQYRFTMTPDDVLADRTIVNPLTRSMCAPIGDGAAAALVCSEAWLLRQPAHVQERAVRVAAVAASGGSYRRKQHEPTLSHEAASRAYKIAGIEPADVDVAEVHDATSFGEILQAEMLGFCQPGAGGPFVASGATGLGGAIPINTSGGLVSKGHPPGATGLSMIFELVLQLRGEAGARQVVDAQVGLAENGGGVLGLEEATCIVTILDRRG